MELSYHGFERIYGRTKMLPEDVLSVISSEAAVDLGSVERRRYFLFYSPPDKDTKVAIVSEDRTRLITIWEKDYNFPVGVKRVTQKMEKEAHKFLQNFLFARIKAGSRQNNGAA